jgi:hypothetical protein
MDLDSAVIVPQRAVLLGPEPKGKGMYQIESLHSYLYRIALRHCLPLKPLLWHCVPEVRVRGWYPGAKALDAKWPLKAALIARRFSRLTLRDDLMALTFSIWAKAFSKLGFVSYIVKWCPQCIQADPYERLIWTVAPVNCCLVHGRRLLQQCSVCHRPAYQANTRAPWLCCPYCGHDRREDKDAVMATKEELWTTRQISKLALAGQQEKKPEKRRAEQIWRLLVRPHFSSNRLASRFCGFHSDPSKALQKYGPSMKFSVRTLLRLCKCLTLDLDELLLGDITTLKPKLRRAKTAHGSRDLTVREVIGRVTTAFGNSINRPMTMASLLGEANVSYELASRKAPDMVKRLGRYFRLQRADEKRVARAIKLRCVVEYLRKHGPGVRDTTLLRAVGYSTPYKVFFAEARATAFNEQRELGLGD